MTTPTPAGQPTPLTRADRFWSKVSGAVVDECWIWTGGQNGDGYGTFWNGERAYPAHRYAYEALRAEIPEGLHIDHLCRVRNCVNPWHLEPVTPLVNAQRGELGHYAIEVARGITHCPKGHPYNEENTGTYTTRSGSVGRRCRACNRARFHRTPLPARLIDCPDCGATVHRSSLTRHRRRQHPALADHAKEAGDE